MLLLLLFPAESRGQVHHFVEGGPRSVGLAGAATALETDPWGDANASARAGIGTRTLTLGGGRAHGLPELQLAGLRLVVPFEAGTVALGAQSHGFEDFRSSRFTLGLARTFRLGTTRSVAVGLDVRYHHVSQGGDYGSAGAPALTLGAQLPVLPTLRLGLQTTNLTGASLPGGHALPRSLAVGLGYRLAERTQLLVDAVKDIDFPLSLRFGLESHALPVLSLRVGAATEPTRFGAGVGVRLGWIEADLAALQHQVLGWSPAASLTLRW